MSRTAPRVYSDQHDIAALEACAARLPDEARVDIVLRDGSCVSGTVAMRPSLQSFLDADGREGSNGMVRIDQAGDARGAPTYFWLDDVLDITRLDATAAEAAIDHPRPEPGRGDP